MERIRKAFIDRRSWNEATQHHQGDTNDPLINAYLLENIIGMRQVIQLNHFIKHNMYNQFHRRMLILFTLTIIFFQGILVASAQDELTVSGVVLNSSGIPVEGVAIGVEKSMELPVISNQDGEFTVKVNTPDAWLNVEPSSTYKAIRINLNRRSSLKIYLTRNDWASGSDQVNILANTLYKRNMVASSSGLDIGQIGEDPSITIDQFMQGKIPGLHVTGRSGQPGSGAFTLTRGINSLNTNNEPLYVIDGLPISSLGVFQSQLEGFSYNPLLVANLQDISQVTFVKDPSLTAAYGSKASNGMVLIKTLDPSATETVIEVEMRTGYSLTPGNHLKQLSASQHKTLISEILFSSGMQEEAIQKNYPNLYLTSQSDRYIDYQHDTNWQNLIFDEAFFKNMNVHVKGGDEIARYGLSFGYIDAGGIIKTTNYEGYNLRFVSNSNIFTWLKINSGVSMTYNNSNLKESAKNPQTSPILTALSKAPMLNPYMYDEEGSELRTLAPVDELGVSNPQAVIDLYDAQNSNFNFNSTLGIDAKINDQLSLNTNFGLSYNVFKELIFMPHTGMELYYNKEAINVSKGANNSLSSFFNNTYLSYQKNFENHFISSNSGMNIQTNKFEYDWGISKNAAANDEYRSLQDGISNLRELGGNNRAWNWLSIYENLNYSYLDKYLLTASVSIDGSSRVGDDASNTLKIGKVPFGLFWGLGAGWRLSSEEFMSGLTWLNELKVRLSYGKTGNDDIGESNANNYYNTVKFRQTTGVYKALIPNSKLTYETVSQLNAGIDLSVWGDRLNTSIDFYRSVTDNMLIYRPLEAYFGYDYRPENGGSMTNQGLDVAFNFRIIDGAAFRWDIEGTWSMVRNQITEIASSPIITTIEGAEIINQIGSQANSYYGYIYDGVFATTEEAQTANLVNERFRPYKAGDAKFRDLSGPDGIADGIINDYDKTVIGSSLPDHFGGLRNTFTYKQWAFSTFIQYVAGNELYNYVRYQNESMSGLENQSAHVLKRWQQQGQSTNVPRAQWEDTQGNAAFSTRWIEDGSYLKIRNIVLSYTLNKEFLVFKSTKCYFTASNLFTFSNYLGYDPEFGYSRMQIDQGIDYGQTPHPRQFIFGLKFGF